MIKPTLIEQKQVIGQLKEKQISNYHKYISDIFPWYQLATNRQWLILYMEIK